MKLIWSKLGDIWTSGTWDSNQVGGGVDLDEGSHLITPIIGGNKLKIPTFSSFKDSKYSSSKMSNNYLEKQQKRIRKHILNNDISRAISVWLVLVQRSDSFLVLMFNKTLRGWYWNMDIVSTLKTIRKVKKIFKDWKSNALYDRVYIEKSGGKLRPLGVPRKEWRVVLSCITFILTLIIEHKLEDSQHGFRNSKSTVTAWMDILKRDKAGARFMYEFDFEACFNRISQGNTIRTLIIDYGIPKYFANYLDTLLLSVPLSKELRKDDKELVGVEFEIDEEGTIQKDLIKLGLPQGWSISPLLAITTINMVLGKRKDLVMYADDGILFSKDPIELDDLEESSWKASGLYVSRELNSHGIPKSRPVVDVFNFLGIEASLINRTLTLNGNLVSWDHPEIRNLIQDHYLNKPSFYLPTKSQNVVSLNNIRKKIPTWTWEVKKDSWLYLKHPVLGWLNLIQFLLWLCGSRKIRRFGWRFISYADQSSLGCEWLLESLRRWNKKKKLGAFKGPIHIKNKFEFATTLQYGDGKSAERYYDETVFSDEPNLYNWRFMKDIHERELNNLRFYGQKVIYRDPSILFELEKSFLEPEMKWW